MSWLSFLTPITEIVKTPLKEWQKRKTLEVQQADKALEREHELNLKKIDVNIELAKSGMNIEADWDTNAQNSMKTTWKDEWFVGLFSIPLVLAFIPSMQIFVLDGFNVLDKTPEWYRWLLIGIVTATFGLRWMFSKIKIGGK